MLSIKDKVKYKHKYWITYVWFLDIDSDIGVAEPQKRSKRAPASAERLFTLHFRLRNLTLRGRVRYILSRSTSVIRVSGNTMRQIFLKLNIVVVHVRFSGGRRSFSHFPCAVLSLRSSKVAILAQTPFLTPFSPVFRFWTPQIGLDRSEILTESTFAQNKQYIKKSKL